MPTPPIRKITWPKSTTNSWFSTSPELSNIVYADTVLSRYGVRKGFALAGHAHPWCSLVRPVGVICLKRMHGDEQWLLSLGDVAGEVALAWPTIATAKEGATSLAVDFQKAPLRLCIVDPHEWQGVRVRWISPVEQLLRGWCTCEDLCARPELLLVAETLAEPHPPPRREERLLGLADAHGGLDRVPTRGDLGRGRDRG